MAVDILSAFLWKIIFPDKVLLVKFDTILHAKVIDSEKRLVYIPSKEMKK